MRSLGSQAVLSVRQSQAAALLPQPAPPSQFIEPSGAFRAASQSIATGLQSQAYTAALDKLAPVWAALPLSPYPPAGDTSTFPHTGIAPLTKSSISPLQLAEPQKIASSLLAQSHARHPKLNAFFWMGIAAAGAALYLSRR
jgi:hypothetical protein